ncbi:MAG: hypothetical protein IJT77_09035, partial [Clostridia bacterium]|nr:hypothetical protein [Clostridia bacterium]
MRKRETAKSLVSWKDFIIRILPPRIRKGVTASASGEFCVFQGCLNLPDFHCKIVQIRKADTDKN